MKFFKYVAVLLSISLSLLVTSQAVAHTATMSNTSHAGSPPPWFTGPLLAPSGHTIPDGHWNVEPYVFYTDSFGVYNNQGNRVSTASTHSFSPTMIVTRGLSPDFDLQASLPFDINWKSGQSDQRFGDLGITLGYQALHQTKGTWIPDLRLTIGELFPTGHYQYLNPNLKGTDSTGAGSYQTKFGGTFQELWTLSGRHYLRGRWNVSYTIPAKVRVHDFNAYGGGFNTDALICPGNHFSTDLAFEYTLTEHWVPAIDFLYVVGSKNTFTGNAGVTSAGLPAAISTTSNYQVSIAPAIEYNFNSSWGLIVGGWFSLAGRNTGDFDAAVFALNYYH